MNLKKNYRDMYSYMTTYNRADVNEGVKAIKDGFDEYSVYLYNFMNVNLRVGLLFIGNLIKYVQFRPGYL